MSVSMEYRDAINERDLRRVRLMLKNSLLYDTSFRTFMEMERYAKSNGVNVWMPETANGFKRKDKPWTIDDMNYEITAIVNDFTQSHMSYLMDVVSYVTGSSNDYNYNRYRLEEHEGTLQKIDLEECSRIIKILADMHSTIRENRIDSDVDVSSKRPDNVEWNPSMINRLKKDSQEIIDICRRVEGGL